MCKNSLTEKAADRNITTRKPAPENAAGIILVSTPWPLFDRPSIQLGTLKAFLNERRPQIQVDACHFYLNIARDLAYPLYEAVSERSWIAESPYAALLYPDRMETVGRFWRRKVRRHPLLATTDFRELCARLESASLAAVESRRWEDCLLAGFSICLAQLTSSLYFIREIKRRAPGLSIVVGGSACAGALGDSLIRSFPDIDFVIHGEGELPLLQLCDQMLAGSDVSRFPSIPGLIHRGEPSVQDVVHQQVHNPDELPVPDYSDYFHDLTTSESQPIFIPRIPMEMSRGCWWNRSGHGDGKGGCTFCNLNMQWRGYRAKSPEKTVAEINTLAHRHQVLSFYFMDNVLPSKGVTERFQAIQALGMDLQLHAEIRAKTSRAKLEAMASAGMREVQVGIEALSTSLLKKLNKGTTTMDNLEIMKHCEDACLPNLTGNLILGFPSSDHRDVSETLENLSFAFPFRPLRGIDLWLGYGSRLWRDPRPYGIRLTGNHPNYRHLFPSDVLEKLAFMMQGYHGDIRRRCQMWMPVRKKLVEWADRYARMHRNPGFEPILSRWDGGTFLVIRERRPDDNPMTHRLAGTSRAIYLFCDTRRSMPELLDRFPRFGEDSIRPFLRMMTDKRLMFSEEDRYLSLAVAG